MRIYKTNQHKCERVSAYTHSFFVLYIVLYRLLEWA